MQKDVHISTKIKPRDVLKSATGVFGAAELVAVLGLLFAGNSLALETIVLGASQDNSLYETAIDDGGEQQFEMSNGAGSYLFSGRTNIDAGYKLRRALLQFELAANLPAGVEIIFAELTVYQSKSAPDSPPVSMGLHRALLAWGEGGSDAFGAEGQGNFAEPGDATWHHRIFPDDLWDTVGGDYAATASAITIFAPQPAHYTWSCDAALLVDVNDWLNNPGMNFGWVIVGNEVAAASARRLNSRENSKAEQRPKLTLVYREKDTIFADSFEPFPNCQ